MAAQRGQRGPSVLVWGENLANDLDVFSETRDHPPLSGPPAVGPWESFCSETLQHHSTQKEKSPIAQNPNFQKKIRK